MFLNKFYFLRHKLWLQILPSGYIHALLLLGAGVKMEHFQAALDPRKQELLEARFLGAKVSVLFY